MRVLLIDEDRAFARAMARRLAERKGPDGRRFQVVTEATHRGGLARVAKEYFDAVIADVRKPGPRDGLSVLAAIAEKTTITIVLAAPGDGQAGVRDAVACMRAGAWDFLDRSDERLVDRLVRTISQAYRYRARQPEAGGSDPDLQWFDAHFDELVAKYPGEVIAVRYAKVLDHDASYGRLARRIERKYVASKPMMVAIPDPKEEAIE